MRTDGQTDMTKLIVAFSKFANARENEKLIKTRTALPVPVKVTN